MEALREFWSVVSLDGFSRMGKFLWKSVPIGLLGFMVRKECQSF